MTDIKLNKYFDIELDGLGDVSTVESVEKAEQHIRYAITSFYYEELGERNTPNLANKLKIKANRVAQELEIIDSVDRIEVEDQDGDFIEMRIEYNYDEAIEFEVI